MHYNDACEWPQEIDFGNYDKLGSGGCQGLTAVLYPYTRDIVVLSNIPDELLAWNETTYRNLYLTTEKSKFLSFYSLY